MGSVSKVEGMSVHISMASISTALSIRLCSFTKSSDARMAAAPVEKNVALEWSQIQNWYKLQPTENVQNVFYYGVSN